MATSGCRNRVGWWEPISSGSPRGPGWPWHPGALGGSSAFCRRWTLPTWNYRLPASHRQHFAGLGPDSTARPVEAPPTPKLLIDELNIQGPSGALRNLRRDSLDSMTWGGHTPSLALPVKGIWNSGAQELAPTRPRSPNREDSSRPAAA